MARNVFLFLLFSGLLTVNAQYIGGNGSGAHALFAGSKALGENLYAGGNNDGSQCLLSTSQPLGAPVFTGGTGDGDRTLPVLNQPLGDNIYSGGIGDGDKCVSSSSKALGINMFAGGNSDGFTFGFALNVPIPIKLLEFKAEWKGDNALLSWSTASEMNCSHFNILRSADGKTFSFVGSVNAAGNSYNIRHYKLTDQEVPVNEHPVFYYQLEEIDYNGTGILSGTVILEKHSSGSGGISLFPNPAENRIFIRAFGMNRSINNISIYSEGGELLKTLPLNTDNTIDVSWLSPGIYLFVFSSGEEVSQTVKVNIQK